MNDLPYNENGEQQSCAVCGSNNTYFSITHSLWLCEQHYDRPHAIGRFEDRLMVKVKELEGHLTDLYDMRDDFLRQLKQIELQLGVLKKTIDNLRK